MTIGRVMMAAGLALAVVGSVMAGPDADRIRKDYAKFKEDKMSGFDRIIFEFEGCEAWVVEPKTPAVDGRWVWCMEWPTAFQDRTGVKELLEAGYRWVTFNPAYLGYLDPKRAKLAEGNQSDAMVAKRGRFQEYLVKKLGFKAKCGLIGMSWGGFYSVRYASIRPQDVGAIYLDAPLLDFSTLSSYRRIDKKTGKAVGGFVNLSKYYDFATADYVGKDDPFQSVNRAEPIAKAKIPVLCIYGGRDGVVPPEKNILRFAEAFEKAGGHLKLWRDSRRDHHPHGLEKGEQQVFVNFFNAAFDGAKKAGKNK